MFKKLFFKYPRVSVVFLLFLSVFAGVEYGGFAAWFVAQTIASALLFRSVLGAQAMPANCFAVTNSLLVESGRFGPGIFARAARIRPIIRLQQATRGAWENGMGVSVGAVTFERMFPNTYGGVWAPIAVSDGANVNACLPPTDTVTFGQTNRPYSPDHMAINTDYFCIRDIQFDFQYAEFLQKITKGFSDVGEWTWGSRYTSEYVRLAGHKLTLNTTAGPQDSPTAYNVSNLPNARLSQNLLNSLYMTLYREGGDLSEGVDENTNAPVFTLITSAEVSRSVVHSDPTIATDNRYAFMGSRNDPNSPLLAGMPIKRRNYGGYVHEIDPYPRKFTFSGGAYHEVSPMIQSTTTKGFKQEVNPAYLAAPYIESIIWHRDNYQSLAVNTVTNPAPGWNFNPHDWMGKFEPRNILDRTCNPDGTMIYFRALFADASKPINPAVGYGILHLDCPQNINLADCYGAYSTYPPDPTR